MGKYKGLALFDFDGTITRKDTLFEFIKFTEGTVKFWFGMLLHSPYIFYSIFVKKDGESAKKKVIKYFYKGRPQTELIKLGNEFSERMIPNLVENNAMKQVVWHQEENHRTLLISASLDIWLENWADSRNLELLCTKMEFIDGVATGDFATPNCNGEEKVNRIKALLDPKEYSPIYAYGNSKGDRPMLSLADYPHYKHFF